MDGPKSSFLGLSESPAQRDVAPNATEQRGGLQAFVLVDLCAIVFIVVVCSEFL